MNNDHVIKKMKNKYLLMNMSETHCFYCIHLTKTFKLPTDLK